MKRDMDLVRALLIEIESAPVGVIYETGNSAISGHAAEVIDEHLKLLHQAGFIDGFVETQSDNMCTGLTWQGHDFLTVARSDTVWQSAKRKLLATGTGATVAIIKELLVAEARRQLGLGAD